MNGNSNGRSGGHKPSKGQEPKPYNRSADGRKPGDRARDGRKFDNRPRDAASLLDAVRI